MRAACSGLASFTMTSMSTVSRGTLAEIFAPRSSALTSSPSWSITGVSTVGVVMMSEYDFTRCCVKLLPWSSWVESPLPDVDTNSWVRAW